MKVFGYERAESVDHAIEAASQAGAAYYAGGTNRLDLMKAGVRQPDRLVDITRLDELKSMRGES